MFSSEPVTVSAKFAPQPLGNFCVPPPRAVLMGAGPPCCTWVIMLAAPPAAAMTYVKPSSGLEPSVYGGGGSPSSRSLLDCPSLVSRGSAALVSATTVDAPAEPSVSSNGGAGGSRGAVAVSDWDAPLSVTSALYGSVSEGLGKYRAGKLCEWKGGGDSAEAEDGSSRRCSVCCACACACESRRKWESTSVLRMPRLAARREGVECNEESSDESTLASGVVFAAARLTSIETATGWQQAQRCFVTGQALRHAGWRWRLLCRGVVRTLYWGRSQWNPHV